MKSGRKARIMGIVNVTPDSFSDGGSYHKTSAAVDHALQLVESGADIIDIGGESTRPYADSVSPAEELARVIPVIEGVRAVSDVPISIDTTKAVVARNALDAGASIINDISALLLDPAMVDLVRDSAAQVVIMHMQGTPGTMQDKPIYQDVVAEVIAYLRERLQTLITAGIDRGRIIVDPGIGFGKTLSHNLSLLKHIDQFSQLGCPVLLGHSRKRFLGDLTGIDTPLRDGITAVVSALCLDKGVAIFRVHDVAATRYALEVAEAISHAD